MSREFFSSDLLQKVKESVNILEVVGEHVVLRKVGGNYVGLCPFHSERTPSFSVSERKQLYHCYGCKKGGDVLSFVMDVFGMSFPEALEDLSERARIVLPPHLRQGQQANESNIDPEIQKKRLAEREKLTVAYKVNRFVAAYYHQMLGSYLQGRDYFRHRGVSEELIRNFYLGTSIDSWDGLASHLIAKKAPLEVAKNLGLIRNSTKMTHSGIGYFDLFRNRVMFPILNLRGKVAGFGGRILSEETPKYLNSPESLIFQKSKLAFGLFQAQKHIREQDEIILVEGYFDVLAMHAVGIRNVVATCGTAISTEHLKIFRRLANRITVLFDGDRAGVEATERAMEVGLENGIVIYGAQMPHGLDPDQILLNTTTGLIRTEGLDHMKSILAAARPLLDVRIEEAIRYSYQGSEERTNSLKQIGKWLAQFIDPIGREVRFQKVEKQMNVTKQLLQEAVGHPVNAPKVQFSSESAKSDQKFSKKLPLTDKVILSGVIYGEEYSQIFSEAKKLLPPKVTLCDLLENPSAKSFLGGLLEKSGYMEQLRKAPELELASNLDPQIRSLLTEVMVSERPLVGLTEFRGALSKSIARVWARFSHQIKSAIAEAESRQNAELHAVLMKEYLDVQRKMKDFSNFYDQE